MLSCLAAELACSESEPLPAQAATFLAFSPVTGASCHEANAYEVPLGAGRLAVLNGGNVDTDRVVDGGEVFVECRVSANEDGSFDVDLARLRAGDITFLGVQGTVSQGSEAEVRVVFQREGVALEQSNCRAFVQVALEGAVWLRDLVCDDMRDGRRPSAQCRASGGVIVENCAQ